MKIQIPNVSTPLSNILSAPQKAQIKNTTELNVTKSFFIQNNAGNADVYVDLGANVAPDTGAVIVAEAGFSFRESDLSDIYLLAAGSSPVKVRLIVGE